MAHFGKCPIDCFNTDKLNTMMLSLACTYYNYILQYLKDRLIATLKY